MTWLDWTLVLTLNAAVVVCGFALGRGTRSSSEWFLGGRALPWWVVGMSMFATNVDSADLVAVTGATYSEGIHIFTVYALGSAIGGILAAFVVVPTIYRLGFYTNAEYLEARFGPASRVLSALIQLQYRSVMLGLMIWSIYLLLTRLVDLPSSRAWTLIVACVVLAGIYTAMGGLKAVVWTDTLQGLIMMVGGAVIFFAVWSAVGGWGGMRQSLETAGAVDGRAIADLAHVGRFRGADGVTSPWLVLIGWIIIGSGYWTVNHTQTMRLMGVRSLWDMKLAAVFGVAVSLPVMTACIFLGVFGRAIPEFQNLEAPDTLFPLLANRYLGPGLKGLVVAAVVAAVVSTFDSMGSALSAIFTRDIYARFFVKDRADRHYVTVSRVATLGVLALGFAYLPLIQQQENMLRLFTTLVPVFVTPLLTIYLLGVTTSVHRRSGIIGLAAGSLYGVLALIDRELWDLTWLPSWLTNRWSAYSFSLLTTAAAMLATTVVLGRDGGEQLRDFRESGWLGRSRQQLPPLEEHPTVRRWWIQTPELWAAALLAVCLWLEFAVLW